MNDEELLTGAKREREREREGGRKKKRNNDGNRFHFPPIPHSGLYFWHGRSPVFKVPGGRSRDPQAHYRLHRPQLN